jgi:Flp pilus assembly protein TadD
VPLHAAGAYAEAIDLYDQALSHAPGDVRLYNNRAIAKLNLEK